MRSIDVHKVNQHLQNGEIVLMTALGYSASGTIFNVKTEQIAASAAAALGASKLIYLTPQRLVETSRCTADRCSSPSPSSHQQSLTTFSHLPLSPPPLTSSPPLLLTTSG